MEDLIEKYEEIIDEALSPNNRVKRAGLISSFHKYAEVLLGLPAIGIANTTGTLISKPDANILLESEYNVIYNFLQKRGKSSPKGHAALIALILGFRCGLRIGEVQFLQLDDIQYPFMINYCKDISKSSLEHCPATLLIRPNSVRKLKSESSQRTLPLNSLLSDCERFELLSYHQHQLKRLGNVAGSQFLFSIDDKGVTPEDSSDIQQILHSLMRHLTGDMSLRFHHLRHSLSSSFLQVATSSDNTLEVPEWFDEFCPGEKTRKALHQLTELVGHSGPGVTLQHYIHNADLLLRDALWIHSFTHTTKNLGESERYRIKLDVKSCILKLLNMSDGALRYAISTSGGSLLHWLPKRLGIANLDNIETAPYHLDEQSLENDASFNSRILSDLSFDDWFGLLHRWRDGATPSELASLYYLNEDVTKFLLDKLTSLFFEGAKSRHKNSRITGHQIDPEQPKTFVLRLKRSNFEKELARLVYKKTLSACSAEQENEPNSILKYAFYNYQEWNQHFHLRFTRKYKKSADAFLGLLRTVIPLDKVDIIEVKNEESHRNYQMGSCRLVHTGTQTASRGVVFGLLLAYTRFYAIDSISEFNSQLFPTSGVD